MPARQCPETATVTVAQAYGRTMSQLSTQLKRNQQFVDFTIPQGNVKFLAKDGTIKQHKPASNYVFGGPRLIVSERTVSRVTFTPTGVIAVPANGQPYLTDEGGIAYGTRGMTDEYPIMSMSSTPA
jgi:hypothetical protein